MVDHEWRRAVLRFRVDVRTALQQRERNGSVPHRRCSVQRRLSVLLFLLVDVRTIVEKAPQRSDISHRRGDVQR